MDNKNLQITNHDFLIYRDSNNDIKVSVMLINNDIWLTQNLIAELFGVGRSTITEHINNILNSGELDENNTVGKTDLDNSKKPVKIYNLDMIIAVGYRVNSKKATNFRIWATKILKEYMIKGVVMDDERLKNPNYIFGEDYFEETLERIRNIRSSERRFYQKITDIYSSCSVDYDKDSEITKEFFKTVQNKLHYAITGNTAAEIIYNRVDSEKENMGLTNWKNSPDGPIYKYDVDIAKNYLNEKELKDLNRIVTMYLDYAELQAENHNAMTMKDWIEKLNAFLQFNGKEILHNAGKISASIAKELAYKEYDKFKVKKGDYSDIQICVDVIFRGYDYLGEFSHSHVNPIYIERIQLPESDARKHYIDYLVETYDKQYLSDYNTATHKEKIKQRIHILSAVMWAQEHHNQIMYLVDSSKDKACFQEMLMEHYYFDREQACAISDMRMSVYTALEKDRTKKEIQELLMKM